MTGGRITGRGSGKAIAQGRQPWHRCWATHEQAGRGRAAQALGISLHSKPAREQGQAQPGGCRHAGGPLKQVLMGSVVSRPNPQNAGCIPQSAVSSVPGASSPQPEREQRPTGQSDSTSQQP